MESDSAMRLTGCRQVLHACGGADFAGSCLSHRGDSVPAWDSWSPFLRGAFVGSPRLGGAGGNCDRFGFGKTDR